MRQYFLKKSDIYIQQNLKSDLTFNLGADDSFHKYLPVVNSKCFCLISYLVQNVLKKERSGKYPQGGSADLCCSLSFCYFKEVSCLKLSFSHHFSE